MWDLIVSVPGHCLSFYFLNFSMYLNIRAIYCTLLFLLCLIIGQLNEISKILMVGVHNDKVKSHAFHFHTERSRNPQHFNPFCQNNY